MTDAQRTALASLCERRGVPFDPDHYRPTFDLPADWVAGWVGGPGAKNPLYVGCGPKGDIHS